MTAWRMSLLAGLTLVFIVGSAWGATSSRIKPLRHGGVVSVQIGSKKSTYHKATTAVPVEFRAKGPGRVRILSRYMFAKPPTADSTSYRIRVEIDGVVILTQEETAGVGDRASVAGAQIGTLERMTIRIPTGTHRVRVYPVDPAASVAVRLLKGSGKAPKVSWVAYQPETYAEAVRLQSGDIETTVYRFTASMPIGLTLHGPAKLKVTTRLDFAHINGVTQTYVIHALLDGGPFKTFALKTKSSHTTMYPDMTEIAPGQAKSFIVDIPSGTHAVTLALDGTTASGASARLYVPKKAIARP